MVVVQRVTHCRHCILFASGPCGKDKGQRLTCGTLLDWRTCLDGRYCTGVSGSERLAGTVHVSQ